MAAEIDVAHRYRHAVSAAQRITKIINTVNIPAGTRQIILSIIDWIEKKSRTIIHDTVSEFINRQLCSLIDLLDAVLPKMIENNEPESSGPSTAGAPPADVTSASRNSEKSYRKSIILQAGAEGDLPEAVEAGGSPFEAEAAPEAADAETTRQRTHLPADDRPDVLLDIPDLTIDNLELEVHDLHVLLKIDTQVAFGLVNICPYVEVNLGSASVNLNNVRANALCVVRMDNLRRIVDNTLRTVERNPDATAAMRDLAATAEKGNPADQSANTYVG